MTVIELESVQEHKKIWAVFGNNEYMPLGKLQLHAACLGWSRHSGNTFKIEKKLMKNSGNFLCPLSSNLVSRLCCHVFMASFYFCPCGLERKFKYMKHM